MTLATPPTEKQVYMKSKHFRDAQDSGTSSPDHHVSPVRPARVELTAYMQHKGSEGVHPNINFDHAEVSDLIADDLPPFSSSPEYSSSSPRCRQSDGSAGSMSSTTSPATVFPSDSQGKPASMMVPTSVCRISPDDFAQRLDQLLELVLKEQAQLLGSRNNLKVSDLRGTGSKVLSGWEFDPTEDGSGEDQSPSKISRGDEVSDLSPIKFKSHPTATSPFPSSVPTSGGYRFIKRFYPSQPVDETELPALKRQKTRKDDTRGGCRLYARRTASLRRAESLKSTVTLSADALVPTVPATPCLRAIKELSEQLQAPDACLAEPVPIIAPPPGHAFQFALNPDMQAKLRLRRFLDREHSLRHQDGLLFGNSQTSEDSRRGLTDASDSSTLMWEEELERRMQAINWILEVMPPDGEAGGVTPTPCSSPSSSGSSETSSGSSATRSIPFLNLSDQLRTSQETRFHAAWLFLRYLYLTMSEKFPGSGADTVSSQESASTDAEGKDLISMDMAVGCLSLSVKLHRDFLDPLLPVFAQEFLVIAPHALSRNDLEAAHRDLLSAFGYILGSSPQAVMDELWLGLPSLRLLLSKANWKYAMDITWASLFAAVCEPDVLRFPISVLTTVALMDGVIESLICDEDDSDTEFDFYDDNLSPRERAEEEAEGVLADIQNAVLLTDAQISQCKRWMADFLD